MSQPHCQPRHHPAAPQRLLRPGDTQDPGHIPSQLLSILAGTSNPTQVPASKIQPAVITQAVEARFSSQTSLRLPPACSDRRQPSAVGEAGSGAKAEPLQISRRPQGCRWGTLPQAPAAFCRWELGWCTEGATWSRKLRLIPDMETINLHQTRSRLGPRKGCDPADYNSRVVHRSTGLIINFQVRDEPPRAPLRGRTQLSSQAVDETGLASIPITLPAPAFSGS